LYGDSRIRAPYRLDYRRDTVRVKGGLDDYHVLGTIDYRALRQFQTKKGHTRDRLFKPLPIGYAMSAERFG
jgi:hypothetical protein